MPYKDIYKDSKRMALETLSKGEVVVKLFEEASKQIKIGIFQIDREDSVKAYAAVAKAQKVISTLSQSLDMQYPISLELREMYDFIYSQLGEANVKKNKELLNDMWELVNELKDAFREANNASVDLKTEGK